MSLDLTLLLASFISRDGMILDGKLKCNIYLSIGVNGEVIRAEQCIMSEGLERIIRMMWREFEVVNALLGSRG